jgi:hypothetical protein
VNADPTLAPFVVVRAARWPVDALGALAAAAAAPDEGAAPSEAGHARRLLAELRALWRMTLGDATFRTALAASHPPLYGRLRDTPCPERWNKAARQLATTLYHHLARACWRTEPHALWAGVGLLAWRTGAASSAGQVVVAPHLLPFCDLFSAVAARPEHRRRGVFDLDAGVRRAPAGDWTRRAADGTATLACAGEARALEACATALSLRGALSHAALRALLRPAFGAQASTAVDGLVARGFLVGGLAFPVAFRDAWEALDIAARRLPSTLRAPWQATTAALRALCTDLERGPREADAIWQAEATVRTHVARLAAALDAPPPRWPRAGLHWDAGLPASAVLDDATRERLLRALRLREARHGAGDTGATLDALYASALCRGRSADFRAALACAVDAPTLRKALRATACESPLVERLLADRRLADRLHVPPAARAPMPLAQAPLGALLARVGREGLHVGGLGHEPWLAYARFGRLLAGEAGLATLHGWIDAALARFAGRAGVRLAQVHVASPELANLCAQPRLRSATPLDPAGGTPGARGAAGLRLCGDGTRYWLADAVDTRPLLALAASALDWGASDRRVERLLVTGGRLRPPPLPQALRVSRTPGRPERLDVDISHRRAAWSLPADAIAGHTPMQRWSAWQRWAGANALPAWITVSHGGRPALLLPRDSALAVEILFRASAAEASRFEIEAPSDEALVTDPHGRRHATEFILLFARQRHVWSARERDLAPVPHDAPAQRAPEASPGLV